MDEVLESELAIHDSKQNEETAEPDPNLPKKPTRRAATVYDVVAGRVGTSGFLTREKLESETQLPLSPEEVLSRRSANLSKIVEDSYAADQKLSPGQQLPDSDLVKAIHSYASKYYRAATYDKGRHDYESMDETALLAIGVLLEEAVKEALGETGDMVLVEPEGYGNELPETRATQKQIHGTVRPSATPDFSSTETDSEFERTRSKRQKRR